MIKYSYVCIAVLLLLSACEKAQKETPNGFKYSVVKAGSGAVPKKGEILIFDFELRDSKDSVWNDSYKQGMEAAMQVLDTAELKNADGITQMLSELKVGDSVRSTMTVPEFFKKLIKRPIPGNIDSTRSLTYAISIKNSMALEDFLKWRKEKVTTREEKMIQEYISTNNLQAQKDTSGIYVIKKSNGTGPKPAADNCVTVKYEGKFLKDGKPFDANDNISFSLNQVITGWKRGFPLLSKGDSATFIIPSSLGYGPEGYYGIPPDAVLLFNVTLIDFKAGFDQATRQCK